MLGAKECAILGAISEKPIHGYKLIRILTKRGYEEWTEISMPSVYRLIAVLERKGLVAGTIDGETRGAPKKKYSVTPAGREALGESLLGHLENPVRSRSSFNLGIAHVDLLDPVKVAAAIRARFDALEDRHQVMKKRRKAQLPVPWRVEALFYHGELNYRAEKKYLQFLLDGINEQQANPVQSGER